MAEKFFWGASTSAHQVEGNIHNNWSKWERWHARELADAAAVNPPHGGWPQHILDAYPNPLQKENYLSHNACDHYNRFESDFEFAKNLGHNAHRFSLEWSRIEPQEGLYDETEIEHYRKVLKALRGKNIEPFVTLWHWTLPLWLSLKGGMTARDFPAHFERYAEKVAASLGDDIRFYITVNEPEGVCFQSYLAGQWPPQKRNPWLYYNALTRLIQAHRKAFAVIKHKNPRAMVGAALQIAWFESAGGPVNWLIKRIAERLWNFHFLNRTVTTLDFIGLNYYFHNRINWGINRNKNEKVSDMGWEICPIGIYHVLKDLKKYNLPVYVTENGLADRRDALRSESIKAHLLAIKRAMDEDVDVRGYFHWSLLDNFEWRKGFWPRFGLIEVDYKTMERKIRPSALAYKKMIESWPDLKP